MPIKKFTSFEEDAKELWNLKPDVKYYDKLRELFRFWSKLNNRSIRKGLQKYKSFKEFNENKFRGNN